jgi:phage baseplate assembly protein V
MIRFGIISEMLQGKARVQFDGDDGIVSAPLPILIPHSLHDQFQFPFEVNQHVACMVDEHCENGVILGAIYDKKNPPVGWDNNKFRIQFDQGLIIEYDRPGKLLKIFGPGDIDINIQGDASVRCQEAKVIASGDVEVEATNAKVTVDANVDIVAPGKVTIDSPTCEIKGHLKTETFECVGTSGLVVTASGNLTSPGTIEGVAVKQGAVLLGNHFHPVSTAPGTTGAPF